MRDINIHKWTLVSITCQLCYIPFNPRSIPIPATRAKMTTPIIIHCSVLPGTIISQISMYAVHNLLRTNKCLTTFVICSRRRSTKLYKNGFFLNLILNQNCFPRLLTGSVNSGVCDCPSEVKAGKQHIFNFLNLEYGTKPVHMHVSNVRT